MRILAFFWLAAAALACKCAFQPTPCEAYQSATVAAIGIAETDSESPLNSPAILQALTQEFGAGLESDAVDFEVPSNFQRLQRIYAKFLPLEFRQRILAASSPDGLAAPVEEMLRRGMTAQVKIQVLFKGLPPGTERIDVVSDFSSCSWPLRKGETYLLYLGKADDGRLTLHTCSHSGPLVSRGDHLPHLHFRQHTPQASARLDWTINTPAASKPTFQVELIRDGDTVSTQAPSKGTVVFDGLPAGRYDIFTWDDHRERSTRRFLETIDLAPAACSTRTFPAPPRPRP